MQDQEIMVGMKRQALRALADRINAECDAHPADEGIEVEIWAEYNGTGPGLLIRFNNEDMEGDHIPSPDMILWDEA